MNSVDCGEEEMGEREFGIEKKAKSFLYLDLLFFFSLSLHRINVFSLHVFLFFVCAFVQKKNLFSG